MTPRKIQLHKKSKCLELQFGEQSFLLTAEYLRVHSPSAEVKGHGPDQAVLQSGKKDVGLVQVEAAGNYALKIIFDDGHNSGIYTWRYLYDLAVHREHYWANYLMALNAAGKSREKDLSAIRFI